MQIYKKDLKTGIFLCLLTSTLIIGACGTNIAENKSTLHNIEKNTTLKDWTFDRVEHRFIHSGFNIKSSADSLKPEFNPDNLLFNDTANKTVTGTITLTTTTVGAVTTTTLTGAVSELIVGDIIEILGSKDDKPTLNILKIATITPMVTTTFPAASDDGTEFRDNGVYNYRIIRQISSANSISSGSIKTDPTADATSNPPKNKIITGEGTFFNSELRVGSQIRLESSGEILTVASIESATSLTVETAPTIAVTTSSFKIVSGVKNEKARNFGAISLYPVLDTNGTTGVPADDVLYFTSDNPSGSNVFAINSNNTNKWEINLSGGFLGNSPTISTRPDPLDSTKKIMYLLGKSGDVYCINTDGRVIAHTKVDDSFKNTSVWVDSSDATNDFVYAASQSGHLYRFKVDFSNTQAQSFSILYKIKVGETSFSSSPVLKGSSLYLGGENGVLYELIPSTGDSSRSWDLSLYSKNGSAKINGSPFITDSNIILIPAGGYLFRIVGSTVTQSPLLELKNGSNSRNPGFGKIFKGDSYPTGTITSSPLVNVATNRAYVSNGNAIFELDFSSVDSFRDTAFYCLALSGRLDRSDYNLNSNGNGNITMSGSKLAMVDVNLAKNSTSFINYFLAPLKDTIEAGKDPLSRFLALNEYDSKGYSLSGVNSGAVSDGSGGNVYFTLNNGSVNILPTP